MTATVILSAFAGLLIGLRLKVPALALATTVIGALTLAIMGTGAAISAVVAVQIGYICSTFAVAMRESPVQTAASAVSVTSAAEARVRVGR